MSTLLHQLKPDGHKCFPMAKTLRELACELQEQIDKVHAELAKVHAPDTGKNQLVDWAGHAPLQLEYFEGKRGDCELVGIRVNGVEVDADYFRADLVEAAEREVASWRAAREAEASEVRADYLHDLQRERQLEQAA